VKPTKNEKRKKNAHTNAAKDQYAARTPRRKESTKKKKKKKTTLQKQGQRKSQGKDGKVGEASQEK